MNYLIYYSYKIFCTPQATPCFVSVIIHNNFFRNLAYALYNYELLFKCLVGIGNLHMGRCVVVWISRVLVKLLLVIPM